MSLDLAYQGTTAALKLRLQELSGSLGTKVDRRAMDLVRIAAYAYWADQMVSRGGKADVYGTDWRREFLICAPTSDPDFWNDEAIKERLGDALGFVSEDVWRFHFEKAGFHEQLPLDTDSSSARFDPDCVALFSGGADSLCALVGSVANDHRNPLVVSHRSAPHMDQQQRALLSALRERVKRWKFPHASIWVNRVQSRERENSQRTRSFLYASLGAAIASALGLKDVLLPDNGVVSLNLPITAQLIGALASRSTHPKFIALFNELAAAVLPGSPEVVNPLWSRTKAECLDILSTDRLRELLQETRSCSRSRGLPAVTPHCGVCLQCVERRFASLAAGREDHDLAERYRTDIFCDPLAGDARTIGEAYVRFARDIEGLSEEGIYDAYPQLDEAIVATDPDPARTAGALASLLKRQAAATVRVVEDQVARHRSALVRRELPATCLLYLVIKKAEEQEDQQKALEPTELTSEDEAMMERHLLKSRLRIHITGEPLGRSSNLVRVDGGKVGLYDTHLRLLLRLVLGLYESEDGYVELGSMKSGGGLAEEGLVFEEELHNVIHRVRASFRPALGELSEKQFIEVSRKRVRLATHRKFVTWNEERLLAHPDDKLRALVMRLLDRAMPGAEA